MSYSEEDLVYLAGFLDGEGCFWINKRDTVGISCTNTYKPVIDWLHSTYGGTVHIDKPKKSNHRVTYTWQLVSNPAVELIRHFSPYLKEKQKQALLILSFKSLLGKRGSRPSKECKEERFRLKEIFKGMKHVSW